MNPNKNDAVPKIFIRKSILAVFVLVFVIISSIVFFNLLSIRLNTPGITELAQFDTGGDAVDVEVHNDIAYVSDMTSNALKIIDVSDPSHPELLSTFQAHGNHQLTVVANGTNNVTIFLTDHNLGLYIINASDPTDPQVLSKYTDPGEIDEVLVVGNLAYVIDQDDGLEIVDISNLTNPQKLGDYYYGSARQHIDVLIRDDLAYLTDYNAGLLIVNISNPANIQLVGSYFEGNLFHWMDIKGNLLFIPDRSNITVIDISDPTDPTLFTTIEDTGGHGVITIKGDFMFVSDFEEGLEVYDISELNNPVKLITYYDGGIAFGHWIDGNILYLADKSDNLEILELKMPHYP